MRSRLTALIVGLVSMAAVVVGPAVAPYLALVPAVAQLGNIPSPNPNCTPLGHSAVTGQAYAGPGAPGTIGSTGGIEPDVAIWCYGQPASVPTTAHVGVNDWVDDYNNTGPAIQQFNDASHLVTGYRVFENFVAPPGTIKAGEFRNTDHWMIDLADISQFRLSGGVLVSPDKTFRFENGKLVVEVDAAAGGDGMGGANRFYEIDISPASAPTGITVDSLYGYGAFGTIGALGCRMERNDQGGNFVCAMYDNSGRATDGRCVLDDNKPVPPSRCALPNVSGRKWETQGVGTARTAASVRGNFANFAIAGTNLHMGDVWRQCGANVHDLHCRDRFRMELTKDSIHLLVNGYLVFAIDGLFAVNPVEGWDNRIPDSWLQQGVRPYFTSWINGGQHTPTRWHWDRVAVNPHDASGAPAAPSAAPSFCLGSTVGTSVNTCAHVHEGGVETILTPGAVTPTVVVQAATSTPTSTAAPTNSPTQTLTPTPTATIEPTATPTVVPEATSTLTPTPTPVPASTATPTPTSTPEPTGGGECVLSASRGGTVLWTSVVPNEACGS